MQVNPSADVSPARPLFIFLFLALTALSVLYRSPYLASNMESFPDSGEYATMGFRFAREGCLTLPIEGRELPSRYAPWFSIVCLAPIYAIPGSGPGHGIFAVTILGMLGVVAAFAIGRRIAGAVAGVLASLLLLFMPDYFLWGRKIMTDIPAVALALWAAWLHVTCEPESVSRSRIAMSCMVIVACMLLRPLYAVLLIPFIWDALRGRSWGRMGCYAGALAAVVAVSVLHNRWAYGSAMENGYRFWCFDSYGPGSGVFSVNHAARNLRVLARSFVPALLTVAVLPFVSGAIRRRWAGSVAGRRLLLFAGLSAGPYAVAHILYSFPGTRFFLLLSTLLAVIAGVNISAWLRVRVPRAAWTAGLVVLLGVTLVYRLWVHKPPPPSRRLSADAIRLHTPPDAAVISCVDPVYLRLMLGAGDRRTLIPLSRRVEYASKRIYHRGEGFEQAVRFVAVENTDNIADMLARGVPVYFDSRLADDYGMMADADTLLARFAVRPAADRLFELVRTRGSGGGDP